MYVLPIVVCPFVLFLLAVELSVLLRYTVSDYPFGIFNLFFLHITMILAFVLLHGSLEDLSRIFTE
jgi:hypothetical protein